MFYQNDDAWFQWNIYWITHFWKFPLPLESSYLVTSFTKTWNLEEWHAILTIKNVVFLQKILSWFGNWGTSKNIFVEIDLFHRKLHLRCDRIAGSAVIRTTTLGKVVSTYPITLSRVSGRLVVIFVGSQYRKNSNPSNDYEILLNLPRLIHSNKDRGPC